MKQEMKQTDIHGQCIQRGGKTELTLYSSIKGQLMSIVLAEDLVCFG
jgi:hypothetical protein